MRSRTLRVWTTPSAAVGSSMKTTFEAQVTARETAMPWRWPPDIVATGADGVLQRDAEVLERVAALGAHRLLVDEAEPAEQAGAHHLAAEEHVGAGVELGREREVLVDGLDPQAARVERRVQLDRLALEEDLAGVGLVDAGQRLDQRRLAGAVVADERDDLVGVDGEARAAQRADAAEALDDLLGFEQGLGHQAGSFSMADTAGSSSALAKSPAATPESSAAPRQPASTTGGASMAPRRRLASNTAGSRAQPPVTTTLVWGPATSSMWAISACDLARHGVDRRAPHRGRRGVGQPHRRALERVQLELERGRFAGSGGERARAELFAIGAELVEHLSQGKAGPHAGQQRLAALGHVPADGHAGLRAAPARGGVLRRGDAHERLGGPARVEHVAGRDHADADAGDEVVVAGHGQHGALGAGQGGAVAAPGVGAGDDELSERVVGQAGPRERVGVGRHGLEVEQAGARRERELGDLAAAEAVHDPLADVEPARRALGAEVLRAWPASTARWRAGRCAA